MYNIYYTLLLIITLYYNINCDIIRLNDEPCIARYCKVTCIDQYELFYDDTRNIIIDDVLKKGDIRIYDIDSKNYILIDQSNICDYILHLNQYFKRLCISWNDNECQFMNVKLNTYNFNNGIIYTEEKQRYKRSTNNKISFNSFYPTVEIIKKMTPDTINTIKTNANKLKNAITGYNPVLAVKEIKDFSYSLFKKDLININQQYNDIERGREFDLRILFDLKDYLKIIRYVSGIPNAKKLQDGDYINIVTYFVLLQNTFEYYNNDLKTSLYCGTRLFDKNSDCPKGMLDGYTTCDDGDTYLKFLYTAYLDDNFGNNNTKCTELFNSKLGTTKSNSYTHYNFLFNTADNKFFCNNIQNNFLDFYRFCDETVKRDNIVSKINGLIAFNNKVVVLNKQFPERYLREVNKVVTSNQTMKILKCKADLKGQLMSVLSSIYDNLIGFIQRYTKNGNDLNEKYNGDVKKVITSYVNYNKELLKNIKKFVLTMGLNFDEYDTFLSNLNKKVNQNDEFLYRDYLDILSYKHDFNLKDINSLKQKCNKRINLSLREVYCKFTKKNPHH